ncbi:hypothetical protein FHS18_004918 [Paenibacillus phyllosphaerae]|uniref:Uncharacterized protein n=1 Tax=Paenibacillus phyllosphaerae TaxID=274593 RepID=A0A7W5B2R3_9BACL|nr:hypothetical protein [Paenibacillus phyllosphaerae]
MSSSGASLRFTFRTSQSMIGTFLMSRLGHTNVSVW